MYNLTMLVFDATKPWIVLAPQLSGGIASAGTEAAADLARCLGILRAQAESTLHATPDAASGGPTGSPLDLRDGGADAPEEDRPIIALNGADQDGPGGYAWRVGDTRIEIWGDSRKGLADGVYDFLGALGFRWPTTGTEQIPPCPLGALYPLSRDNAHLSSHGESRKATRRLVLEGGLGGKEGEAWLRWAARNRVDAVVIPFDLDDSTIEALSDRVLRRRSRIVAAARRYGFSVEEGGRCLSRLVPRRLFFRHRDLFRMREGKRTADFNFCPTNPETITLLWDQARRRFRDRQDVEVFHLWPDLADDGGWCSCPSCRAFSPSEQALIAVNAVADALAEVRNGGRLSYISDPYDSGAVKPRKNLIPVEEPRKKPEAVQDGARDEWIFAYRSDRPYT